MKSVNILQQWGQTSHITTPVVGYISSIQIPVSKFNPKYALEHGANMFFSSSFNGISNAYVCTQFVDSLYGMLVLEIWIKDILFPSGYVFKKYFQFNISYWKIQCYAVLI